MCGWRPRSGTRVHMGQISVDQATAGMLLVSDVVDRLGRLLIPAGKELTEKHVGALKMWGVTHVEIEGQGPAADAMADIDEADLAIAESEVAERFANAGPEHPFLNALRRACVHRVALDLSARSRAGIP